MVTFFKTKAKSFDETFTLGTRVLINIFDKSAQKKQKQIISKKNSEEKIDLDQFCKHFGKDEENVFLSVSFVL